MSTITIAHDTFTDAIAWISRAVATNPTNPMLAGVLLETDPAALHVSAFDGDTAATITIPADTADATRVVVSGPLLGIITKLLPTGPVTLTCHATEVILTCMRARFTLPTLPTENYPALPATPPYLGEADATTFARAVAQVAVAASTDPTQTHCAGVLLTISPGQPLRLVGTDTYRLATRTLAWQPTLDAPTMEVSLRVDARALHTITRHLAGTADTIRLSSDPNGMVCGLSDGTRHATLRTNATPYVPYQRALEHGAALDTATIDSQAVIAAVKRAATVAQRGTQIVLTFTHNDLQITGGDHDTARAEEHVPIDYSGASVTLAFQPGYLIDALGANGTEHVQMALIGPSKPLAMTPVVPEGQTGEDYLHIAMPMRHFDRTPGVHAAS